MKTYMLIFPFYIHVDWEKKRKKKSEIVRLELSLEMFTDYHMIRIVQ
jgi:hypothetical protein